MGIGYAAIYVLGLVTLLMGSLLPRLPLTLEQGGTLGAFPIAGIFVGSLLIGPALDRWGARPVLILSLGLAAGAIAALSVWHRFAALVVAAFLYGLGGGFLNTAANALTADLSPRGKARAMNLLGAFFSLGAITAPLLAASPLSHAPVAVLLRLLAALVALLLLPVLLLRFPPPAHAGVSLFAMLRVLRAPAVWIYALMLFFESAGENTQFVWAGKLSVLTLAVTPAHAAFALLAVSGGLGLARLSAAVLVPRIGGRITFLLSAALLATGSLLAWSADRFSLLLLALALLGWGMGPVFPTALAQASEEFPTQTGTIFSAVLGVAMLGGALGPLAATHLALAAPRHLLLITLMAAAAVALFALRRRPAPTTACV